MRHDVSVSCPDCRNASADANVRVRNPYDITRLSIAPRITLSSSTIEISGALFNRRVQYEGHADAKRRCPNEDAPGGSLGFHGGGGLTARGFCIRHDRIVGSREGVLPVDDLLQCHSRIRAECGPDILGISAFLALQEPLDRDGIVWIAEQRLIDRRAHSDIRRQLLRRSRASKMPSLVCE